MYRNFKKAQEKNLSYISITDHNTCKAYGKLVNPDIRNIFNEKIITGVELNTKILGYGINTGYMNADLNRLYIN